MIGSACPEPAVANPEPRAALVGADDLARIRNQNMRTLAFFLFWVSTLGLSEKGTAVEVFEIFLSRNSADKPPVEEISHKTEGLLGGVLVGRVVNWCDQVGD